jgi:signal transduction histidine kinase
MPKYIIFFLIILSSCKPDDKSKPMHYQDVLIVKGQNNEHLSQFYTYYKDNNNISPEKAKELWLQHRFLKPILGKTFNHLHTEGNYWLALRVKNDSTGDNSMVWSFYNDGFFFNLYDVSGNKSKFLGERNSLIKMKYRTFPFRPPAFRIVFQPKETKFLLVKVTPIYFKTNVYFPTDLTTTEDMLFYENYFNLVVGKYLGFLFFAALMNLILFLVLRNRIYFWMSGYVLMIIGFNITEFLLDISIYPEWFNLAVYVPQIVFASMAYFCLTRVFQIFTEQKKQFPRLYRVLNYGNFGILFLAFYAVIATIFIPVTSMFFNLAFELLNGALISMFVLLLIAILVGLFSKKLYFIYFSISHIAFFLSFFHYLLDALDINTFKMVLFPGNVIVGATIEISILSVFFIVKYKKERAVFINNLVETQRVKDQSSQEILMAQESERKRIAEDLHDDLGGTLSTLKLMLSNTENIKPELINLVNKATKDLKEISAELLPKDFENEGFFSHLEWLVQNFNQESNIVFELFLIGDESSLIPPLKISLYRIISEIIHNIVKHSMASLSTIQLIIKENQVTLMAEDNGIGLSNNTQNKGIGIKNMKSRVNYFSGRFEMTYSPNGTHIIIEIPLNKTDDKD